jgi:regulator of protease activity HflC (stomatin/prohibitin superfamily)
MFGLILGIIFVLAALVGAAYCYVDCKEERAVDENGYYVRNEHGAFVFEKIYPLRKYILIPIVVGILLAAITIGISCVRSVPTGHTGVVTSFGKVENYTLDAGIHFMKPWAKVVKMDNRVQKNTLQLACFSSDIQEVNISYTINYQIDKKNAMNIYKSVGTAYYDTVIAPNVTEAVKEVTALYTAENLVNCREEMSSKVESVLAERLIKHNVEVVNTAIEDMDFTDAFTNAVEAKQVAQQNKLKAETVAAQKVVEAEAAAKVKTVEAQAKAEADKIAAEAEAYQISIKADAEAEANKKLAESITGTLIDYEYAQNWDGKLPTYMSGDAGMIPVINK